MQTIILNPEQTGLTPLKITVPDKTVKKLRKMQYNGGFKRFGLDIYEIVPKQRYNDYEKLGQWLGKVFN